MFDHLDYFFGNNTNCTTNPCFTKWFMKNAQNTNELYQTCVLNQDKKLDHLQKFFRMFLSDNSTMFYYSFCYDDIVDKQCHKYTYGIRSPCSGCGGKGETSEFLQLMK